ncbi:hypothetical protein Hsw_1249 [Hymenobacter swuensis DY53]|uniref:Uncharacterized protein n=1 Tax=Hymenobacter swuensis DY53 TaxID=1227739 RepID=W8EUG8_9BACT|nr:hypothetical protein Hsw_1249 [Hymenobacter swuensis DY53]
MHNFANWWRGGGLRHLRKSSQGNAKQLFANELAASVSSSKTLALEWQ